LPVHHHLLVNISLAHAALIEILDAALDLVSSVDEEDDIFMVAEKSSSTKKDDDAESA
jgi:hypothetical protein